MYADSARWYSEELVKRQEPRLATFPACSNTSVINWSMLAIMKGRADTFLSFMEDWRSWVVDTCLLRISELLPTPLMNTLLGHCLRVKDSKAGVYVKRRPRAEGSYIQSYDN